MNLITELATLEGLIDAILKGNYTKDEIHGRLLMVWGKVRTMRRALGDAATVPGPPDPPVMRGPGLVG